MKQHHIAALALVTLLAAAPIALAQQTDSRRQRWQQRLAAQQQIIEAIQAGAAKLHDAIAASLEAMQNRPSWQDLSDEQRTKLRAEFGRRREEWRKTLADLELQVAKLKGVQELRGEHEQALTELEAVYALATREGATDTAARLGALLDKRQRELSRTLAELGVDASSVDGVRKLRSADRQVIAESAAWPTVMTLADGSVAMMYQLARRQQDFDATNVCMLYTRSTDSGETWSKPVLVGERRGAGGKLFERKPNGGYISFQERNQALGQLPSGRIVAAWCRLNYHYKADGSDDKAPDVDRLHTNLGVVHTWSDDLGETWVEPRYMDLGPFLGPHREISPHWRIITLGDGTALMSLYGDPNPEYDGPVDVPEGTRVMAGVMRSTDGQTWSDPSLIMHKQDGLCWEESALCLLDSGRLLSHTRTGRHNIVQYTSDDKGRTWQGPVDVTQNGQQPGGAFQLRSGKVLCTWGNRRAPFGAAAMLSHDGAKSWDFAHRVSLAWDATNANCGYANGTQTPDGTIIVAYYIMHYAGGGDYRRLWGDSKVYIVRFTEEQFRAAAQ